MARCRIAPAEGIPAPSDTVALGQRRWHWYPASSVWANMGLWNATPMASFYWLCALSSNWVTTWMHPHIGRWHMVDFINTRCRDKMNIHSTRAMRGANNWTDHRMLRSKVAFRIRQKHNRQGTSKPTMLNTVKIFFHYQTCLVFLCVKV